MGHHPRLPHSIEVLPSKRTKTIDTLPYVQDNATPLATKKQTAPTGGADCPMQNMQQRSPEWQTSDQP